MGRHLAGSAPFIVAHDMGTSVATELLRPRHRGQARIRACRRAALQRQHRARPSQPDPQPEAAPGATGPGCGPAHQPARLSSRVRRHLLLGAPARATRRPPTNGHCVCHNGGRTLGHRLIHYLDERERYAERWHGAVRDWSGAAQLRLGDRGPGRDHLGARRADRAAPAGAGAKASRNRPLPPDRGPAALCGRGLRGGRPRRSARRASSASERSGAGMTGDGSASQRSRAAHSSPARRSSRAARISGSVARARNAEALGYQTAITSS